MHLIVWRRFPNGTLTRVGEIRISGPDRRHGGAWRGEFRYAPAFLDDPRARSLDPVHLPLGAQPIPASVPESGLHGVFEDSLPDAWGQALLVRHHRLARADQHPARLLACLGASGLGALSYGTDNHPPSQNSSAPLDTASLVAAALKFERDPDSVPPSHWRALFQAASSPGGARPKVLINDAGRPCLAKLASAQDRVDMVRLEAASLTIARQAGLVVPNFRVETFGPHAALLVERFDVSEQGRWHLLSAQTLLGARGWYQLGYADLADAVRTISVHPETDLPALYRQTVLNALLGNTDDHLKNFALRDTDAGWRLAPAYDLLPDVLGRREHVLHFGAAGHRPNTTALRALGRAFGLSAQAAQAIRDQVIAALHCWTAVCEQTGVPDTQAEHVAKDIARRIEQR